MDGGRVALAACCALGGGFLAALPFQARATSPWLIALVGAAFLPHPWVASVLAWRVGARNGFDARTRRGWRTLAIGFAVVGVNTLIFYASRRGLLPAAVVRAAEGILPLAWGALALAGLRALVQASETPLARARFWLDTTTVFCAGCIILIFTFSHTPGASSLATLRSGLLTVAFPALGGAVLFVAAMVLLRPSPGVSRAAIGVFAASLAISVVADLSYGRTAVTSGHRADAWYRGAYMIAALLALGATQIQREARPGRPAEGPWTPSSVIPYAMVGGAVVILLAELGSRWNTVLGGLVLGAVALTILVVARQLVVRLETEELAALQRAQDRRFRSLVEHASDIVSVVDREGTVSYQAGDTALALGKAPEEFHGQSLLAIAHPDDAERLRSALHGRMTTDHLLRWRARHASGEWRDLETTVTDLGDEPSVNGIVLNTRDVTTQVRLEAQLNQAQKLEAVGLLAAGIAHDFNNILAAIRASAELAASAPSEEGRREDLAEIASAVDRGAALTRQLLVFGRRDVVQAQVLDLRTVMTPLEPMLRRLIPGNIELRVALPAQPVPVRSDPTQIEQIALNLCLNARDAIIGDGTITLGVERRELLAPVDGLAPGTYGVVSVRDTGPGIEPSVIDRMFEPFFTTKPRGLGSGLGLSTVYGIAQRAGGGVVVRTAPGAGTVFDVFLPISDAEPPWRDHADERAATPVSGTVLVLDDESAIRESIARYLRTRGYSVATAGNGPDALSLLAEAAGRIDILVSDLSMPGTSGWDLVAEATARHPRLRVVIMSGYLGDDRRPATLPPAVTIVLAKPFDLADLERSIRETLSDPGDGGAIFRDGGVDAPATAPDA